jgi:alkylation response protein AidB-like acyl-CoA dehydrogenase
MDFELSAEHEELRRTLAGFVAKEIAPVANSCEKDGKVPDEIVATMASMGLFGLTVPEEFGGLGADTVSLAIVFEEISAGWMGAAGVLGTHTVACAMLARFGTEEQKRRWLPALASGQRRSGLALTEPGAGSDLQGISTVATREGSCYVVRGTKTWITNARHADPLPVLVKTDPAARPAHRGMSILMIEAGTPGMMVSRDLGKLGYRGPETCEVVFDDCRVPSSNLLGGQEGRGLQQALSALQVGRVNIAARAVGVARAALEAASAYSKERHAFGRPIGEFQAVQHRLAEMATGIQAARLLTWWAASVYDQRVAHSPDSSGRADVETAMAKVFASELALRCALDSMRIHGAYGYSTELDVERLYRDAPLLAIGEGTNDILRTVIANGIA